MTSLLDNHKRFQKRWLWATSSLLALVLLGAGVHFYYASAPRGAFLDPYIDPETYWVFKGERVYLTTERGLEYVGRCSKVQGKWVLGDGHLQPFLFGVRWFDPQFQGGSHFLPRRCFAWFYYKLT